MRKWGSRTREATTSRGPTAQGGRGRGARAGRIPSPRPTPPDRPGTGPRCRQHWTHQCGLWHLCRGRRKHKGRRRPTLDITSEESCIDHQMKNDVYCTLGGPPTECIIKYQNIGGTMTCSTKWRSSFWVVCGDACAWTEGEFDSGTWLGPGLAAIIYAIMMIFF